MSMREVTYSGYGFDKNAILEKVSNEQIKDILSKIFYVIEDEWETEIEVTLDNQTIYVGVISSSNNDNWDLLFLIPEIPAVVQDLSKASPIITMKQANDVLFKAIATFNDEVKSLLTDDAKNTLKDAINDVATDEYEYWDLI